ncbi:MAG TPA: site-2 protease family protein [Bryobacteraceae bacterium]|nr:site-2 protease family protein [Bryobacteraceae bacterium]
MFGRRVTLFNLFGFAVRVDASWLIIAVLIAWTLALSYFPAHYRGLTTGDYWMMGIASAIGLFASIVVHEFSHSLVARGHGLPMKGITLFIFGGVAEMGGEPPNAGTEFLMAIAGPIASVLLGAAFYLVYLATRGVWPVTVTGVLGYLGFINIILAAFNLIPAFPLDGGRVLRSALWHWKGDLRRATRTAAAIGGGFGIALMLFAVWQWIEGDFIGAMWYFLIGMFVRGAAQSSYQQLVTRMALEGEPVRRFMNPHPIAVPSNISLQDLVEDYVYRYHHKMFPVLNAADRLAGCVTTNQVKALPRDEWNQHSVQEVLRPCSPDNTVAPDADAMKALSKMSSSGLSRLMVTEGDRLVGVISLKDLLNLLAAKVDLEGDNFPHHRLAHP